jgi:hypothetical protein
MSTWKPGDPLISVEGGSVGHQRPMIQLINDHTGGDVQADTEWIRLGGKVYCGFPGCPEEETP